MNTYIYIHLYAHTVEFVTQNPLKLSVPKFAGPCKLTEKPRELLFQQHHIHTHGNVHNIPIAC